MTVTNSGGKNFKLHKRFSTLDHFCEIFFLISAQVNFHKVDFFFPDFEKRLSSLIFLKVPELKKKSVRPTELDIREQIDPIDRSTIQGRYKTLQTL